MGEFGEALGLQGWIWNWFLGPWRGQKSIENVIENLYVFRSIFESIFGAKTGSQTDPKRHPQVIQKYSKNHSKNRPEILADWDRFWAQFATQNYVKICNFRDHANP